MLEHTLSAGWGMLEGVARTMATSNPRVPSPHPPPGASQRMRALRKHSPGFPESSRQSPQSSNQPKWLIPSELVLSLWLPLLTLQGGCCTCILLFPLSPLRGHRSRRHHFPSCPGWLHTYLLTAVVAQQSSCQLPAVFYRVLVMTAPHGDVVLMYFWKEGEPHIHLLCHQIIILNLFNQFQAMEHIYSLNRFDLSLLNMKISEDAGNMPLKVH